MNKKAESETPKGKNIHERLQLCRAAVRYVIKEKKKVNGQYYPLSYNAVVSACESHLLEHGVSVTFDVVDCATVGITKQGQNNKGEIVTFPNGYVSTVKMLVTCSNETAPDDAVQFNVVASAWHSLDKAPVIAQTFCKKEAYKAIFHLESYEDGEGVPSADDREPPAPAQYERLSAEQVESIKALAAKIGVTEEIVAKSADASYVRVEEIPVAKYQAIFDRMMKRAQQLGKQGEENGKVQNG